MAIARADDEALVLYPATIALATNGVISDPAPPAGVPVQGAPLGIFKEVTRANGTLASAVKVLVDPPLDTGLYVEITLWLNGVQNGPAQSVVDEIMTFDLFQSDLRDGAINVIQYKLKNHAGNISESTELWALYSATLPGGNNVPGTGEHPALAISLPAELGNPASIGKDEVDKGVLLTFDYPYRKAHDTITYEINRERFTYTVKPDEVDKPVSVLIDRAKFEMIGSLENCPFSYTVVDQLLNATHQRRWSKPIYANIDIDRVTLEKPILREDPDDDMDDPTIVDLEKLQGRELLAVIIPQAPTFQKDDDVLLTYRSSASDVDLRIPGKITASFGVLQPCIVSVPNDQIIAGSDLEVFFELSRPDGKLVGQSKTATATVVGTRIELEPPSIKEASGNVLDPFAAKDTLTAIVPAYNDMIGTQVSVTWTGTPGEGSVTVGPVNVTAQMDKEVTLPNTVVAFNLGKAVKVIYTVFRNGVPQNSRELDLSVLSIVDGDSRLPTPAIDGAEGNTLEVSKLQDDAKARVARWLLQAAGQRVWLFGDGINANGEPTHEVILEAIENKSEDGLTTLAAIEWLRGLKDDSTVTITFKVNYDGNADVASAVTFPVRTYTVSAGQYGVPSFTNAPYIIAPAGRLKNIELLLSTSSHTPLPMGKLRLTLPTDFTYIDDGGGQRDFIADDVGRVSVSGVKGGLSPGSYSLSATSGIENASTIVTVKRLGPVGNIPVAGNPSRIAVSPDGTRAYVCDGSSNTIRVIDTTTSRVLTSISVSSASEGISISSDGARAYVGLRQSNTVAVIDTATNQVLTNIPVGKDVRGVSVSPDGTRAYACNHGSDTVSVIVTATDQVLTSIPVESGPYRIAINPNGTRAYVCSGNSDKLSVIDTATDRFLATIPIGEYSSHIAVSPDGIHVYVCTHNRTVEVIDTATDRILTRIPLESSASGIAISPDSSRAYVSLGGTKRFSVIDTKTNRVLKTIEVGMNPEGVAFSPDGTRVFMCIRADNVVSVIYTTI